MNQNFAEHFKNKKVMITGHTGFKGAWLTLWLNHLGAEVTGYSLKSPTEPALFEILNLADQIEHIEADVRDYDRLQKVIAEHEPEFIFHMAAQSLVRPSYKDPLTTYSTNVMGTVNLLEAVKSVESVKVVINVTSDKCYENRESAHSYRENDAMGGYDPYSSSKGCSELITSAFRNSYFNADQFGKSHHVSLATVRAGNVIGGGDWASDRLIPDCIRALNDDKKIVLRYPNAVRPWQYVLEPLSGYLLLASYMYQNGKDFSQAWNFGPDDDDLIPVEEVAKEMLRHWGEGEIDIEPDRQYHEAELLKLDISKARSILNWRPVYNCKEAVKRTALWYRQYYRMNDTMAYSIQEIEEYMERSLRQRT